MFLEHQIDILELFLKDTELKRIIKNSSDNLPVYMCVYNEYLFVVLLCVSYAPNRRLNGLWF